MVPFNQTYRTFTLDNGLVVALQNTPTQTISGRLRVHYGGLHEREGEEGLAHFLEHTVMKGGGREFSPDAAEETMGTLGAIDATTNTHETRFMAGMLAEDLELYLNFISDVVFDPRFDPDRVNQERQRVLREIADAKSNPGFQDQNDIRNALYGLNSPYNHFVLGKEEVITRATPEDLKAFHQRGYGASNMDLILVGGLPQNVEELVVQFFAGKLKGNKTKYVFPRNQELEGKIIIHKPAKEWLNIQSPESSSAYLGITFTAPTAKEKDYYAVEILNQILGGNANSRLFRRISQEMGFAYAIESYYTAEDNAGVMGISGSIQATRVEEAIEAIFQEMDGLKEKLVNGAEIAKIKSKKLYRLAEYLGNDRGRMEGIEIELDTGLTPELHSQRIEAVTPEMIREAANKYFPKNREFGRYVLFLKDPLKF